MKFSVKELKPGQEKVWEMVLEKSNGDTIFHHLDFLAYHGNRFIEYEHHLVFYNSEMPFGVMPLAIFEEDRQKIAKSPYGGSYGGPIFNKILSYSESKEAVLRLIEYLYEHSISLCKLTFPIQPCYKKVSETFLLALIENGFTCINRDISSVVNLSLDNIISEMDKRARNMARKASKYDIKIVNRGRLDDFWTVMVKTFDKIDKSPTHSYDEFNWLHERMPSRVYVDVAYFEEIPVAGIGYFVINERVNSSFYLCQDPVRQDMQALSLLIHEALLESQQCGFKWFDFGTSSVNMHGRENIFRFKESFGAVGYFRDTYVWKSQ